MINSARRREAAAIANGDEVPAELPAKVAAYGLYAQCLRASEVASEPLPRISSFNELRTALHSRITDAVTDGYEDMPASARNALNRHVERLYLDRSMLGHGKPENKDALRRLDDGADTAAYVETLTMRSLASRLGSGQEVSERGLYGAQVPLRLSLLPLQHIGSALNRIMVHDIVAPSGGDMFGKDYVSLDYHRGLVFTQTPDPHERFSYAYEAQLGCPASMIQKYIHALHCLAVQASLEGGLLDTSQIVAA